MLSRGVVLTLNISVRAGAQLFGTAVGLAVKLIVVARDEWTQKARARVLAVEELLERTWPSECGCACHTCRVPAMQASLLVELTSMAHQAI